MYRGLILYTNTHTHTHLSTEYVKNERTRYTYTLALKRIIYNGHCSDVNRGAILSRVATVTCACLVHYIIQDDSPNLNELFKLLKCVL